MRDDCPGSETKGFEAESADDDRCEAEAREWCEGGEWGDSGAVVTVWYELFENDADESVSEGRVEVEIEANHDAMIRAAGGDTECDHDWTSDGEGGCDENPGVWSTGGTSMTFASHCRTCGLHRVEKTTGSQRNPGEHDTVAYSQPINWCADCESEECTCE